jgi:GT2 family glycosyltransferase
MSRLPRSQPSPAQTLELRQGHDSEAPPNESSLGTPFLDGTPNDYPDNPDNPANSVGNHNPDDTTNLDGLDGTDDPQGTAGKHLENAGVVTATGDLGSPRDLVSTHSSADATGNLEMLTVSVIVAAYNRLEGLQRLLVDLSMQDCEAGSFEVIVVDDESEIAVKLDVATTAVAGRADGELPFRLRIFRRKNGGPGVARDTGIRQARGSVIVILDDDMLIGPEFIHAHQEHHQRGATVVLGNIQTPRQGSLALFERFHMATLEKFVAAVGRGEPVVEGARLCTGNVSFRTSAYRRVGGFDASLRRCEDRDLGIRFEVAGERIVFGGSAISQHRSDHSDAATWRKRNRLYGELDTRIAAKHVGLAKVSPWAFLSQLPKAATPVGLMSAACPPVGSLGAQLAYRMAQWLDRRSQPGPALRMTGLSYGLDYYAGVGLAYKSPRGAIAMFTSYRAFRNLAVPEATTQSASRSGPASGSGSASGSIASSGTASGEDSV